MIGDITLGQYYPVQSPVHSLDPRAKIILSTFYIVIIFLVRNLLGYLPCLAFLVLAIRLSKIPFKLMLKPIKGLRILLIFTFVLNLFFASGGSELFRLWFLRVSREGLYNAVHFSTRLIFLVLGTSILTLTTSPVMLTDALEKICSPLKVIKFPAHEMAMMMTIALRFIPTLLEEADKIMKAQTARGADFKSGKLIQRAKAMLPILVPLFVSAFRRAGDLAMAMEARCYHGGEGRTRLNVLKYSYKDLIALISLIALLVLVLVIR